MSDSIIGYGETRRHLSISSSPADTPFLCNLGDFFSRNTKDLHVAAVDARARECPVFRRRQSGVERRPVGFFECFFLLLDCRGPAIPDLYEDGRRWSQGARCAGCVRRRRRLAITATSPQGTRTTICKRPRIGQVRATSDHAKSSAIIAACFVETPVLFLQDL